jgi:hypothetical protein
LAWVASLLTCRMLKFKPACSRFFAPSQFHLVVRTTSISSSLASSSPIPSSFKRISCTILFSKQSWSIFLAKWLMVLPELSPQSPKTIVGRFVPSSSAPKFRTHSPGRAHHTSSAPGPFSWGGYHVTIHSFPRFPVLNRSSRS